MPGPVDGSVTCDKCELPLCGEAYMDGPNHRPECRVFAKLEEKVKVGEFSVPVPLYSCITGIRLLSLKEEDKDMWDRLGMWLVSQSSLARKWMDPGSFLTPSLHLKSG